ncbi:hypothetical protein PsYK624_062900 [Phanerochaete sordida]|uniref:CCHC-type domain-containing protein n=1 Tax=Phanerochaete sordida TaxID=48140 RepID=A0A9P3G992_9APHY|nr:hypothetical protein PsYK624_062900 [Phanerochaete sordida]
MSDDPRTVYTHSHFPLLNETNYPEWIIRLEAYLIRRGLWFGVVVIATETAPESVVSDPVALAGWVEKQWLKRTAEKMAEARAEIILKVDDSQLPHMTSRDPKVILEDLARVHMARGFATRLSLRRQFSRLVKGGGETMSGWIGRVKKFAFRLQSIGVTVSEEDKIIALTNGLPESYDPLVTALDATPADELTLTYVIDRLLNEEVRRNGREEEVKIEMAMVAAASQKNNSSQTSLSQRKCWNCDQVGHVRAQCKEPKKIEDTADARRGQAHFVVDRPAERLEVLRQPGYIL